MIESLLVLMLILLPMFDVILLLSFIFFVLIFAKNVLFQEITVR